MSTIEFWGIFGLLVFAFLLIFLMERRVAYLQSTLIWLYYETFPDKKPVETEEGL